MSYEMNLFSFAFLRWNSRLRAQEQRDKLAAWSDEQKGLKEEVKRKMREEIEKAERAKKEMMKEQMLEAEKQKEIMRIREEVSLSMLLLFFSIERLACVCHIQFFWLMMAQRGSEIVIAIFVLLIRWSSVNFMFLMKILPEIVTTLIVAGRITSNTKILVFLNLYFWRFRLMILT